MVGRNAAAILILSGLVLLFPAFAACASNQGVRVTSEDDESRAVTPDVDWSLEDVAESQEDDEDSAPDVEIDDGSGGAPTEKIIEAADVEFKVFVNGSEHPIDEPLELYENQMVEVRFHLTATGSELARYMITTSGGHMIPKGGELEGMEADVSYNFTYNMRLWQEGGIIITVVNRQGDTFMRNLPVSPAMSPGLHGGE